MAVNHPLAQKRSVSLARLRQERLLGYSREDYPEYADWIAEIFQPKRFDAGAMEEYDSATGLIAAVEAGRGVALVSASMKCLTGPRVKLLALSPALAPIVVGALSAEGVPALTKSFIATAKKAASAR